MTKIQQLKIRELNHVNEWQRKRIESLEQGYRILHTWASVPDALIPRQVLDLAREKLEQR